MASTSALPDAKWSIRRTTLRSPETIRMHCSSLMTFAGNASSKPGGDSRMGTRFNAQSSPVGRCSPRMTSPNAPPPRRAACGTSK